MQSVELATLFQPERLYKAGFLNRELPYFFPEFPREKYVYMHSVTCGNKSYVYKKYLIYCMVRLLNSRLSAQLW